MNLTSSPWAWWLEPLLRSSATVLLAVLAGWALGRFVLPRVARLAAASKAGWDDVVVGEVKRRLVWWSVLAGAWLSFASWPVPGPGSAWRAFGASVLFVLGAVSVTSLAITVATRLVAVYGATLAPGLLVTGLARNLLTILIGTMGGLVILNGIGIEITPMLTALGVGGLAVALAMQEPLGNLFAGFFIAMAGQVRVGDYVRLESGLEGYVADFGWRSARIRQLSNNIIIVPNSKLSQATLLNFHLPEQELAVLVEVGVDYDSDLSEVERVTIEEARGVMKDVEGGVPGFNPFIRFHTFADSSINLTVILRCREYVDQYLVRHEFIKRLHARYAQAGIIIPFPQRTVGTRGPLPAVPSPAANAPMGAGTTNSAHGT